MIGSRHLQNVDGPSRTIAANACECESGEIPFRKAWLQAIVDRVEVDADVIRIVGDKASLEAAVIGAA